MSDEMSNSPGSSDSSDQQRTKRVTAVGWTAGVSAFFLLGALTANATWPVAVGVIAVAAMVAAACYFMLR